MSSIPALILASLLLFILLTGILIPLGGLVSEKILGDKESKLLPLDLKLLLSFGISIAFYSALVVVLVGLGASNTVIRWLLSAVILSAAIFSIKEKAFLLPAPRESIAITVGLFLYLLLTISLSAFPNGSISDISALETEKIATLPIDNLIPYNISRYLESRINPNSIDVVPNLSGDGGWKFGERGPLGGLFAGSINILLGITERTGWLAATPGPFFVFQFTLSYLNLLSALAIYLIARRALGPRAALFTLLTLGINYFYFINVMFSWPKLLSAYFVATAVLLWSSRIKKSGVITGIFLGLGILSHDMALFSVLALATFFLLTYPAKELLTRKLTMTRLFAEAKIALPYFLGLVLTLAPWKIVKSLYLTPSPQLIFMHVFCDTRPGIEKMPFSDYLAEYLGQHPFSELFAIRLANLFYPFDLRRLVSIILKQWHSPIALLNSISMEMFLRFLPAIGLLLIPIFVAALFHLLTATRKKNTTSADLSWTAPYLLAGFGALPWYALGGGCLELTVNHHWVYLAFISSALLVGSYVSSGTLFTQLFFAIALGLSAVQATIYLFFHSQHRPLLHGTTEYFILSGAIAILLGGIGIILWLLSKPEPGK